MGPPLGESQRESPAPRLVIAYRPLLCINIPCTTPNVFGMARVA